MLLEMKVHGIALDPFTNAPIVVLKDADEKNTLPIWIGALEASAIASEMENITLARPMTHDLFMEILRAAGMRIARVEVNDLRNNIFYATLHIESGGTTSRIDSRPSDAIALALRARAPIFVDDGVLDRAARAESGADKASGAAGREEWAELLEKLSPADFGKYKM